MFINKWSQLQQSPGQDCLYVFASLIKNCQLKKEPLYIPFVFICPHIGEKWSVILNQGLDKDFKMITTGYSILTDHKL